MNASEILTALALPLAALVDQRVPKKLLLENSPATAADERRISDGVEELRWLAALKPSTIGVPELRDAAREYLEIAVLSVTLRAGAQPDRLAELVHRAVPYPVFLISSQPDVLELSLAHKRHSNAESAATVLDGEMVVADLLAKQDVGIGQAFATTLALARQPHTDLFVLYQGWIDTLVALLTARVTGVFAIASSPALAAARHSMLREYARLEAQITRLRSAANKERQISRQVEINAELKRVRAEHSAARSKL